MTPNLTVKAGHGQAKKPVPRWVRRYKTGRDALTDEELKALYQEFKSTEEEALLKLAIASGMRREDIVGVEIANIDEVNGQSSKVLQVKFYQKKKGREHLVTIADSAAIAVIRQITAAKRSRWLFPGHQHGDRHLSSKSAYNIFQRILVRAKLRQRPFHALRATCIKRCHRAGWTDEQIMELTDDRLKTIQEHYMTPTDSEMIDVAQRKPLVPSESVLRALREKPIS